jgi:hypothetical protein
MHTAQQIRVPHTPGFPVNRVGVDEPLAAFLNEKPHTWRLLVPRTGNPGISPAFGEMWEMKLLSRASLPGDSALPRKHHILFVHVGAANLLASTKGGMNDLSRSIYPR